MFICVLFAKMIRLYTRGKNIVYFHCMLIFDALNVQQVEQEYLILQPMGKPNSDNLQLNMVYNT